MRLALLDDLQDAVRSLACFEKLREHQVQVLTQPLRDDALVAAVGDCEGLVLIRERTKITAALLARLPKLKIISQTGRVGPHLDLAACTARKVVVTQTTGSPFAPAELTFALILASQRALVIEASALTRGQWQTGVLGQTVRGQSLGILGYGAIGRVVAGFGRAFGMKVIASGREDSAQRAALDGVPLVARDELFERSDVLSVHLKLTEQTKGSISSADFALMKPSALFVNTSRADVVQSGALVAALDAGRPGRAALDVFEVEPATADPLVRHPRVLATPHLGYLEHANYELYFGAAFNNLNAFAAGHRVNVANPEVLTS